MRLHRGLVVLCLLSVSLVTGVGSVAAQSQVDEAEQRAEEARSGVDSAYAIVTSAVANRDSVEAELVAAMDDYADAALRLTQANHDLDRISRSLAFADARAADVEQKLADQTVAAYMESVMASAGLVFETSSLEDAMVANDVLSRSQREALGELDRLLAQRRELGSIRADYAQERDVVSRLTEDLADRSAELEDLLKVANADVATAFARASEADDAYRAALSDVDRARAAEEAARRATTTTTTAPSDGSVTTTTSPDRRPIQLRPSVEAWRPLVTQYFAPDLVEDALAIMQCESHGDPEAVNPYSGASGLFQFLPGTWAVASVRAGVGDRSVFDGEANIIAASWLAEYYRARGLDPWRPWTCRYYL